MSGKQISENFDFSKTCRLCLIQNKELVSVFYLSSFEISYSIIINECTNVTIFETDELPKNICSECAELLNKFYQFRRLALNSELRLHEFLTKIQTDLNKDVKIESLSNIKEEIVDLGSDEELNVQTCSIQCEKDSYGLKKDLEFESTTGLVKKELEIKDENVTLTQPNCFPSDFGDEDNKNVFDVYVEKDIDNNGTDLKNQSTIHKKFNCVMCTKTFSRSFSLKKHLAKSHNVIKIEENSETCPLVCLVCRKTFTYRSALVRHERKHTGEKPYKCKCGKSFNRFSHLRRHERVHTGEKPFTCKTCGKSCNELFNLKIHERTHTGDKPYICKQCGKSFIISSHLKRHELIHTGEKPHKCKRCEKSFAQSGQLKLHQQVHTGKKLYKCKCGKSFTTPGNLKMHERIHVGGKSYICKQCGKSFARSDGLKKHEILHKG